MTKRLTPPRWQQDAVLSLRGWLHPKTNELLVSRKYSFDEVTEYNLRNLPKLTAEELLIDLECDLKEFTENEPNQFELDAYNKVTNNVVNSLSNESAKKPVSTKTKRTRKTAAKAKTARKRSARKTATKTIRKAVRKVFENKPK